MKNLKRAKVHMLPTEDSMSSPFYVTEGGKIYIWGENLKASGTPQHLYITTDEEIKEGDWVIETSNDNLLAQYNPMSLNQKSMGCRKIIATTDPKLIPLKCDKARISPTLNKAMCNTIPCCGEFIHAKPLPQPSKAFIEAYCKTGGIDEVDVEGLFIRLPLKERMGEQKIHFEPKVTPNNEIITHQIKESYSRDEVIELIKRFKDDTGLFSPTKFSKKYGSTLTYPEMEAKWIEENL